MRTKLKLVTTVAQIAALMGAEKIHRSRLDGRLSSVPANTGELTTEWLTAVLCRDNPAARVTDFELGPIDDGSTTRRRVFLDYNPAGQEAGLPKQIFTKAAANLRTRLLLRFAGAAEAEVGFYQQLQPELNIETPRTYYAGVDPRSTRYFIAMEDVGATKGASFGSPVSWYVDLPSAQSMMDQLASLHARFWGGKRLEFAGWLPTPAQWLARIENMIGWEAADLRAIDKGEKVIPEEFMHRRNDVHAAIKHSLELNSQSPRTLLHSDVHLGNWYQTSDGVMGLFDWQCITTGQWASDVVYALMSALTIDDRREWERSLLQYYLDRLSEHGVEAPSFNEAWLMYRQQTFHGLSFWLVTLGANAAQPDMQPEDIALENVARMTQAVIDLESFDALEQR